MAEVSRNLQEIFGLTAGKAHYRESAIRRHFPELAQAVEVFSDQPQVSVQVGNHFSKDSSLRSDERACATLTDGTVVSDNQS